MVDVINLEWHNVSGNNMAQTSRNSLGFYFIWFDGSKIKSSSSFNREHIIHDSFDKGKIYCQEDFKKRINENLL